ncbi:MAG: response regulator [Elusimicrobiota bacterium]|jgi:CheY-like chemotaxis protein
MTDQNAQTPSQGLGDPKEKLVLLVDDDDTVLDLLEHIVKREGFRYERAEDGQAAIRKAEALLPDSIILDFMLPGLGGFEVLKHLQAGDTRNIPIVIITGRRIDRQTVDMVRNESNVREFIEKPVRPASLAAILHRLMGTRPPELDRRPDRGPLSSDW